MTEFVFGAQVERSYLYANTGTRVSRRAKEILHVEIKRNDISVLGFSSFSFHSHLRLSPCASFSSFLFLLKLRQLDVVLDF